MRISNIAQPIFIAKLSAFYDKEGICVVIGAILARHP
jgi:hypothetical protein